jgi:hypothetical protein
MFKRLFGRKKAQRQFITVVSGLPRSGTSMMMKMLEAGGIPPIEDGIRTADTDNPKGYYEFERVKQLDKGDHGWLPDAMGKSVKIISALLLHVPSGYDYRVLFMRRPLDEILASQAKMLQRRGADAATDDEKMKELYQKHVRQVETWLTRQPNIAVLDVDYTSLVKNPLGQITTINNFLGGTLDEQAMATVVDPTLYRNRKASK